MSRGADGGDPDLYINTEVEFDEDELYTRDDIAKVLSIENGQIVSAQYLYFDRHRRKHIIKVRYKPSKIV